MEINDSALIRTIIMFTDIYANQIQLLIFTY